MNFEDGIEKQRDDHQRPLPGIRHGFRMAGEQIDSRTRRDAAEEHVVAVRQAEQTNNARQCGNA